MGRQYTSSDKVGALRLLFEDNETQASVARTMETSQPAVSRWMRDEYLLKEYQKDCIDRGINFNLKKALADSKARGGRVKGDWKATEDRAMLYESSAHAADNEDATPSFYGASHTPGYDDVSFDDCDWGLTEASLEAAGYGLESGIGEEYAAKFAGISMEDFSMWTFEAAEGVEPFKTAMRVLNQRMAGSAINTARAVREGVQGAAMRIKWLQVNVPHWYEIKETETSEADRASDMSDDLLKEIIAAAKLGDSE